MHTLNFSYNLYCHCWLIVTMQTIAHKCLQFKQKYTYYRKSQVCLNGSTILIQVQVGFVHSVQPKTGPLEARLFTSIFKLAVMNISSIQTVCYNCNIPSYEVSCPLFYTSTSNQYWIIWILQFSLEMIALVLALAKMLTILSTKAQLEWRFSATMIQKDEHIEWKSSFKKHSSLYICQ